jgi:hypothetical protein
LIEKIQGNSHKMLLTIDFFDHDTKLIDLPNLENISKIFSFKNIIDEFYLNFLEKETALIEIFIVKSG